MSNNADNGLISVREAAKLCGRNPETVRRWIWSGKLPAEKLGNQLFIKRTTLDGYYRETAAVTHQAAVQYDASKRLEVLEQVKQNRERIRARIGRDFTEDEIVGTIERMQEERTNELSGLR